MFARRVHTAWALGAISVFIAVPAIAQPADIRRPPPEKPTVAWTVAGGYESFSFRDVAHSGPPVGASPVRWEGSGPALIVGYARARATTSHRFEAATSFLYDFSYNSGVRTTAGPADDRVRRVIARYDYRRFPFTNVLVEGLDVGIGVQGVGSYLSLTRHVPLSIETGETATNAGVAGVVGARLRRWSRLGVEVEWINGALLGRSYPRHTIDSLASVSKVNGAWLTDVSLLADMRLGRRVSLRVVYLRAGEGLLSNHHSYAISRRRVTMGIRYGK